MHALLENTLMTTTTYRVWTRFSTSPQLTQTILTFQAPSATLLQALPSRHVSTSEAGAQRLKLSTGYPHLKARPFLKPSPVSLHRSLHTTSLGLYSSRRGRLSSIEDAQKFLAALPIPQRTCLEKAVMEARQGEAESEAVTPPTWNQLKLCEYEWVGMG